MKKKKYRAVMLVDDNELDNLINRKTIEDAELSDRVYIHTGAKSAIEFLRNVEGLDIAKEVIPDLIILDVDMPFMDGFQFLEEFKRLSPLIQKTCRIMILTSSDNVADSDQSKKYSNVTWFARKPLSKRDFAEVSTSARS